MFESGEEILLRDHSIETSSSVRLSGAICQFTIFDKTKIPLFPKFRCLIFLREKGPEQGTRNGHKGVNKLRGNLPPLKPQSYLYINSRIIAK